MKSFLLAILFCCTGFTLRADSLWVHHIGVGQGDATLIVAWQQRTFPAIGVDTTSILIDAGNSSGKGLAVYNYVNDILGSTKHLNFVITSHLHSDHIGGMPTVLYNMALQKWKVDFILDRGAQFKPLPDICYSKTGDVDNDPIEPEDLPGSNIYKDYQVMTNTYFKGKRTNCPPGVDLFRILSRPMNMSMLCVASNGCVLKTGGSGIYTCPQESSPDENDYSFAFLLQFNSFKYFTAGDLGGAPPYLDLETPLISYFKTWNVNDFHFCGFKASHHGSGNSNNQAFVNYTKPQLTVIPSALRSFNGTQLPWQSAYDRLRMVPGSYLTYTYHYLTNPYSGSVDYYFDVKFKVNDPEFCTNVALPVYARSRAKTSPYAPASAYALINNYACTQPHNRPSNPCTKAETTIPAFVPQPQSRREKRLQQRAGRLLEKAEKTYAPGTK